MPTLTVMHFLMADSEHVGSINRFYPISGEVREGDAVCFDEDGARVRQALGRDKVIGVAFSVFDNDFAGRNHDMHAHVCVYGPIFRYERPAGIVNRQAIYLSATVPGALVTEQEGRLVGHWIETDTIFIAPGMED